MDEIRAYAQFDREELLRELELCDPTVIVCGYTASVMDIIFKTSVRKDRNENLFYHIQLNGHDVLVLDYWHPANQYPDVMNYYGLMSIYQQALLAEKRRVERGNGFRLSAFFIHKSLTSKVSENMKSCLCRCTGICFT